MKCAIFLADGFETCEGLITIDMLRRASIPIDMISMNNTLEVTTSHGVRLFAEKLFSEIDPAEYDVLIMPGGKPRKFKTVQELQKCLDAYKKYLTENNRPPTIAGLAYYTGVDRHTIYNYEKQDEYFHTIKNFRDWVLMTYEEEAIVKGNGGIVFMLKNYGYTDRQDHNLTGDLGMNISFVPVKDK